MASKFHPSKAWPLLLGFVVLCGSMGLAQGQTKPAGKSQPVEPASPLCAETAELIEDALKEMALGRYGALGDNSAPRESNRQLRVVAASTTITNLLLQRQSLGCPAYTKSLSPDAYRVAAAECSLATGSSAAAKCVTSSWRRDVEVKPPSP